MDDEIRAALTALADRAPAADPVRHRVAVRAKTLRQRRAVLAVAGAVAVGATVPLAASRLVGGAAPFTPASPGPAPSPSGTALPGSPVAAHPADPAAAGGNIRIPLRYRASWLPDGFVEIRRDASVTGPQPGYQLRAWARPGLAAPGSAFVQVALLPRDGADVTHLFPELPDMGLPVVTPRSPAPRREVRVGDQPGLAWQTPTGWVVEWYTGDGMPLAVQTGNLGESLTTALRVAESVVPDGNAAAECAVQLSWLPAAFEGAPHYVSTWHIEGDEYRHRLSLAGDRLLITWQQNYHPALQEFGDGNKEISPPQGSVPFSFQGRSGTLLLHPRPHRYDSDHEFWVKLAGGRGMAVRGRSGVIDEGDFRRIVTGVRVGSQPYVDWIGRR